MINTLPIVINVAENGYMVTINPDADRDRIRYAVFLNPKDMADWLLNFYANAPGYTPEKFCASSYPENAQCEAGTAKQQYAESLHHMNSIGCASPGSLLK